MMQQKIYFIYPDAKTLIQLSRQVDHLNKNGFNAIILYKNRHSLHLRFANTLRVEYNTSFFLLIKQSVKTGKWSSLKRAINSNMLAIQRLMTSELGIRIDIDSGKFYYWPQKKKRIAFRKIKEPIVLVLNLLKYRNSMRKWSLVHIDYKSEEEAVRVRRDSPIFLSFDYFEGFGLSPLEAMACGCIPIAYVRKMEKDPNTFYDKQAKGSQAILEKYSLENEEQDIVIPWNQITNPQESNTITPGRQSISAMQLRSI